MAQLGHGLVEEAEAVRAALGQLTAVRVDRQLAVERDPAPAVEPVLRLAEPAEAERLEPGDRVEREAVVDQCEIDRLGAQARWVQRWVAGPSTCGSWVIVSWSHDTRPGIRVPTAPT